MRKSFDWDLKNEKQVYGTGNVEIPLAFSSTQYKEDKEPRIFHSRPVSEDVAAVLIIFDTSNDPSKQLSAQGHGGMRLGSRSQPVSLSKYNLDPRSTFHPRQAHYTTTTTPGLGVE